MVGHQEVYLESGGGQSDFLVSCHFPFNWPQLSAAGGDGGQPRGGEEYPEPGGGQFDGL